MPGRACDHCGLVEGESVELKRCGRCKRALYCGRECQAAAWAQHKQICNRMVLEEPGSNWLPAEVAPAAEVPDAPEPAPGECFGRPMEKPEVDLPFPLTREGFEASLPQLMTFVEYMYNVALTAGGRRSAECSPQHGIFLYGVRKGQPVPGGKGEIADKDETRMGGHCFMTMEELVGGKDKERFANQAMQQGIDSHRAQAALFTLEQRKRENVDGVFRVTFEGVVVTALCPGVRRCFRLDMLPGGRRDGRLVRAEPAVECSDNESMVFMSRHPRFHPAP